MKAAPHERIARHLTLMAQGVQHMTESLLRFSEELDIRRIHADAAREVALEVVCKLLPPELRPTIKRLVELRQAIWHREVETLEVQA